MPSKHFSQTPPDRANDLFDKILATSDSATKTRERLFVDLKDELELLASLQEQHLFPILQRHGMQDLLSASINDNEETASLLQEARELLSHSLPEGDMAAIFKRGLMLVVADRFTLSIERPSASSKLKTATTFLT